MRFRRTIVLGCALAAIVLSGCENEDVNWGPSTSYYKDELRVIGDGYFYNDGNVRAANTMRVHDAADDGNRVYGSTTFRYWARTTSGDTTWVVNGGGSTSEVSNTSVTQTITNKLHKNGSRARGQSVVCAQMGFPVPDSCSSPAYPTFNY